MEDSAPNDFFEDEVTEVEDDSLIAESVSSDARHADLPLETSEAKQSDQTDPEAQPERKLKIPGPGLGESTVWFLGVFAAQIFGGIVMFTILAVILSATNEFGTGKELLSLIEESYQLELIGGSWLIFVVLAVLGAFVRLGSNPLRKIGIRKFPKLHALFIVVLILPLSSLAGTLHQQVMEIWKRVVEAVPGLQFLDNFNSMQMLEEFTRESSLLSLILIIAVAPAIAEEVVFRGIIGRGLSARWGVVFGVVMTSLFFGLAHVHPAHAIAVVPLGMCMHYVYIVTKSFWAPVMLHFLNNSWAVVATKMINQGAAPELADNVTVPPEVLIASAVLVILILILMWQTRVRYLLPDGTTWTPGFFTIERPPQKVPVVAHREPVSPGLLALTLCGLVGFGVVFFQSAL